MNQPSHRCLLAAGLIPAVAALLIAGCESDAPAQMPPLPVQTVQVERKDVPLSIEMVGATLGSQDVPIRARVEGFLEGMFFEEGRFVKKDDRLYLIDQQPFQAKMAAARSELAAAQTRLANARADLGRIRPLAEMKAVSAQDLDSAVAKEEASQAGVQAARAQVELARIELSYTDIRAPIDGLIGLTKARPGEFVGREPNPVVLNVLSDIDPIRVRFSISEREYLILARTYMARNAERRGSRTQPETVQERPDETREDIYDNELQPDLILILADGSEHPHKGEVIATSQSINPETGTYSVEAVFPNPEGILLPGQFARVKAPYETLKDAVVVPRRALVELQGLFQVYVVKDDNTVEVRAVTPGPIKDNVQVIEAGLEAGETIIIEGTQRTRAGMTVAPAPFRPPSDRAPLQAT